MNINLIGVPMYYGSDRKGVELGPDKLREKNLIDILSKNNTIYDLGNLFVPTVKEEDKYLSHPKMKYLDAIKTVNTNLAQAVYSSLTSNSFPLIIGGDHSLGLGSICGASRFYKNLAVIWIDAHGDINTESTSPTGNVHGMPLASAMDIGSESLKNVFFKGQKVKPENVFLIGPRDLDRGEVQLIKDKNITCYSTEDVKTIGLKTILNNIYNKLKMNNVDAVHVSFDIDCIDSKLVPGTGTPVKDGMSIEEGKYVLRYLMETNLVKSMDFVEVNPVLDENDITSNNAIDLLDYTFNGKLNSNIVTNNINLAIV